MTGNGEPTPGVSPTRCPGCGACCTSPFAAVECEERHRETASRWSSLAAALPEERNRAIYDVTDSAGRHFKVAVRRVHGDPPPGGGWSWIPQDTITGFKEN